MGMVEVDHLGQEIEETKKTVDIEEKNFVGLNHGL